MAVARGRPLLNFVIPAKAGIQRVQMIPSSLGPRSFHPHPSPLPRIKYGAGSEGEGVSKGLRGRCQFNILNSQF